MLEGKALVEDTDMPLKMQIQAMSSASQALDLYDVFDCKSIAGFIKKSRRREEILERGKRPKPILDLIDFIRFQQLEVSYIDSDAKPFTSTVKFSNVRSSSQSISFAHLSDTIIKGIAMKTNYQWNWQSSTESFV
ncbi:hypothetical protein J1N35_018267 [Gossypium stocksii]|uniref:Uncharacterized protein n=1 Tax=Gossypium stocksii TaxID=47602 RepID=A0A9D3VQK4_9ROSI|nr:hypothetical protein J1N35_018267 [Gossypium stocksii]